MGTGYYNQKSQWSDGSFTGATNPGQDDVDVITRAFPVREDAVGDTAATAVPVSPSHTFAVLGIIETRGDSDVYSVTVPANSIVTIYCTGVYAIGPGTGNLDVRLEARRGGGGFVAGTNPPAATDATLEFGVATRATVYIHVAAAGAPPTGNLVGYSNYGSLGRYNLSGTVTPAAQVSGPPDQTVAVASGLVAFGVPLIALAIWRR